MIDILINLYNRSHNVVFDEYYQEEIELKLFPNMFKSLKVALDEVSGELWNEDFGCIIGDWNSNDIDINEYMSCVNCIEVITINGKFNRSKGKNFIARNSRSDYLLFLDADMILPKYFMFRVCLAIEYDADAWFPHCKYYANARHTIETDFVDTAFGNMLIRRSIFESMGGFREYDEWGKEDVEFYQRLTQISGRYKVVNENVEGLYHQWHPASMRKNIV